MPISPFESSLLLLLAKNRNPESHVAGASVLNQSPESPRSSQDIDLFHDTLSALDEAMEKDVQVLRKAGCEVTLSKTLETFRRAEVRKNENSTRIEWAFDSAFRFFPTQSDPLFGYRLSIWDAATNKVLADAQHFFDAILNDDAPYGCFFLDAQGTPQTPTIKTLPHLKPHYGSVRGCWPRITDGEPGIGR